MSNVFRKEYRTLTEAEINKLSDVKEKAQELLELINDIEVVKDQRYREFAIKDLEQAIMWAVKSIT